MNMKFIWSLLLGSVMLSCNNSADVEPVDIIDSDALKELASAQYTVYNRSGVNQWISSTGDELSWDKSEIITGSSSGLVGMYLRFISPNYIIFHQGEVWTPFSFCDTPVDISLFDLAWRYVKSTDDSRKINLYLVDAIDDTNFNDFNNLNGVYAEIKSCTDNKLGLNFQPKKCDDIYFKEEVTYHLAGTKYLSPGIDLAFKNRLEVYEYILNEFKLKCKDKISIDSDEAILANRMEKMLHECVEQGDMNPFLYDIKR